MNTRDAREPAEEIDHQTLSQIAVLQLFLLKDTPIKTVLSALIVSALSFAATASFAQSAAPSDAQIAGIVVAANTVDIEAGKLAKSKSKNKEVKNFAQLMITDHTGVNKQATGP